MTIDDRDRLEGMERIGPRLRLARRAAGKTLKTVATEAGVTAGFISLAERGKTRVSVPVLLRICAALDIQIGDLFDYPQETVVPSGRGALLEMGGSGITEYILTPASETRYVVMQTILRPGGGSGGAYTLPADSIFVFVVLGKLRLTVDGAPHELTAGDSMSFPAHAAHEWNNPADRESEVLWTIAPALSHDALRRTSDTT